MNISKGAKLKWAVNTLLKKSGGIKGLRQMNILRSATITQPIMQENLLMIIHIMPEFLISSH